MEDADDLDFSSSFEEENQIATASGRAQTRRKVRARWESAGLRGDPLDLGFDLRDEGCRTARIIERDIVADLDQITTSAWQDDEPRQRLILMREAGAQLGKDFFGRYARPAVQTLSYRRPQHFKIA